MRALSEIKGEEALDILAEIIVPITDIAQDKEVRQSFDEKNVASAVSVAIKKHKKAIIEIFAKVDGKTYEEELEEVNLLTLPAQILTLLNEPTIQNLFL